MKNLEELKNTNITWYKLLKLIKNNEGQKEENLIRVFKRYQEYKHVLKNKINPWEKFKVISKFKLRSRLLESIEDEIEFLIHNHKKEKLIKNLKTKKYEHLFNDSVIEELNVILDNKIDTETLEKQFFNKLAKYKSSEELKESLIVFKNKSLGWTKENCLKTINENKLNVKIMNEQNDYFMIEVLDYESCKYLGAQAWCIVQREYYFKEYKDKYNKQIIALNFNKDLKESDSMIGFTVNLNGEIIYSHLKDDKVTPKKVLSNFKFEKIEDNDLPKDLPSYKLCSLKRNNLIKEKIKIIEDIDELKSLIMSSLNGGNLEIILLILKKIKETNKNYTNIDKILYEALSNKIGTPNFFFEFANSISSYDRRKQASKLIKYVIECGKMVSKDLLKNPFFCEMIKEPEIWLPKEMFKIYKQTMITYETSKLIHSRKNLKIKHLKKDIKEVILISKGRGKGKRKSNWQSPYDVAK